MANNYINKVIYGDDTLMDLTEDSVTPETLMRGETAHDRSGAPIVGTMTSGGGHTIYDAMSTTMPARAGLKFEGTDVRDDSENDMTVVEGQCEEVDEQTWSGMTEEERNNPNKYFYLPWTNPADQIIAAMDKLPIGSIVPFMGNTAPEEYLICDGQLVDEVEYSKLAAFFQNQFNDKYKFGGSAATGKIGVPDLRGEFLRGTGTNGHSFTTGGVTVTCGSGENVGAHQHPTLIPNFQTPSGGDMFFSGYIGTNNYPLASGVESEIKTTNSTNNKVSVSATKGTESQSLTIKYSARPTNTSVLYIIKAKEHTSYISVNEIDDSSIVEDRSWSSEKIDTTKADKSDLASISITGTTNNTGSSIASGTYFYLNGVLVQATATIAANATLTENTNYNVITAGALNCGGCANVSRVIQSYSVSYTGSAQALNVDYTLTEDAWVYIMFSVGNGNVSVTADNKAIYQFANYISTSSLVSSSWVKLPKGTRIKTTNTASNGIYQASIVIYGIK